MTVYNHLIRTPMNTRFYVVFVFIITLSAGTTGQVSHGITAKGVTATNESRAGGLEAHEKRGSFTTASIIADSMVVQQKSNVPIWGTGSAGAVISITASWGKGATTVVGPDGKWIVKIPTPAAGGPFTVTIKEQDTTVVLANVLAGEVWLASGQSNMEIPVAGWPPADTIENSAYEILHSRNSAIRMFTVNRGLSMTPEPLTSGSWISASPEASGKFSAAAYFFAQALQQSLHVPIGIIHSSWGGTMIEPWMSAEAIARFDEYKATMEKVAGGKEVRTKYEDWLHTFPTIDMTQRPDENKWAGLNFQDEGCSLPDCNDSLWKEMTLPQYWERTELGEFDGVVWFRKTVEVPSSWLHKKMTLELGPVDDMDRTFVNGILVGGIETTGMWNVDRVYSLPDTAVGKNTVSIAVRVVDPQGGGGIYGTSERMVLRLGGTNETVSLAGSWKYLPVASYDGKKFSIFGGTGNAYYFHPATGIVVTNSTPTALYNAMIAPLIPYTIKGAIWYQGEANTGNSARYASLLSAMITDWRTKFKCGEFPFYYAQIAPFTYPAGTHSELLREAQCAALGTKNTGMAVTLDIGSMKTIHPSQKKEVGRRLALWALAKNYGRSNPYSGPVYRSMKKANGTIVLSFDHAGKRLVLKGTGTEFHIAGDDKIFKPASVALRGNTLVVSHPDITHPAAVRYAFTDTSSAVLFNTDGLPASSFRTDRWK